MILLVQVESTAQKVESIWFFPLFIIKLNFKELLCHTKG